MRTLEFREDGKLMSTGVEALDARLGGVPAGRHILVTGPSGVGKSVLALHFMVAGLDRGEACLLVTGSDRDALDSRGLFVGFSPGPLSRSLNLTRLDMGRELRERGLSGQAAGPVEVLKQVIREEGGFRRIVIDDLQAFCGDSPFTNDTTGALARYLEETGAAAYVVVSDPEDGAVGRGALAPLEKAAGAILELQPTGRGQRRLDLIHVRQPALSTEPFLFTLRSGAGISEDLPAYHKDVERSLRRKVVILDENGTVPAEVLAALGGGFELEVFTDLEGSLLELLEARYGVLVMAVDPYEPERAFDLTYTLRKAGNGAPILFISPTRGLRSMTRSRGLRIGGDDFLLAELPPAEIVERIRITAHRGHHRRNGSVRPERQLQPVETSGSVRPMDAAELGEALSDLLAETPLPFFALAVLRPAGPVPGTELWDAVRPQVRLKDGDLLGLLPEGELALVLAQVDAGLARKVLARVRRSHPALEESDGSVLLTHPLESGTIRDWSRRLIVRA